MIVRKREAGQIIPLVALGLVVVVGILGFAVDVGYARYMRRTMQTAADAAAIAGAEEVAYGDIVNAGTQAATENGYTTGSGPYPATVTVVTPPTDGVYAAPKYANIYVEAKISQVQPTFFSKIFGVSQIGPLTAYAVAMGSLNCIYALDPTSGNNGLNLTAAVVKSTCGAVDNASVKLTGGSFCAPSLQYLGTAPGAGGGLCPENGENLFPNPPTHIVKAVTDPFAYLTAPCTGVGCAPAACAGTNSVFNIPANTTINVPAIRAGAAGPGYCGGITVGAGSNVTFNAGMTVAKGITISAGFLTGTTVQFASPSSAGVYNIGATANYGIKINSGALSSTQVSFAPATYYIAQGIGDNGIGFLTFESMNLNSSCTATKATACTNPSLFVLDGGGANFAGIIVSGGGETIFNTSDATHTAGGINFALGTGATFMEAPTTGGPTCASCAGILFWQPSTNTSAANFSFTLSATGTGAGQGAFYVPNAVVNFTIDLGFGADYTYLVAKDINWFLNYTFNSNTATLSNSSPIREGTAVLVQ